MSASIFPEVVSSVSAQRVQNNQVATVSYWGICAGNLSMCPACTVPTRCGVSTTSPQVLIITGGSAGCSTNVIRQDDCDGFFA